MTRPNDAPPLDDDALEVAPDASPTTASRLVAPDLATLPIAGITGRRMAVALGILLAVWIVLMFARQVGDAAAASTHADALVISNAEQASRVAALSRELQQIQRQRYIDQEARAYGLGKPREIAFTLDPNAPSLPPDAPGSASVRLGSEIDDGSPLDHWLTLLFGASD
jgi:cell division protein FtsB